ESVTLAGLPGGTYYFKVSGANGAVNPRYSIFINAPQPPRGDWAEGNQGNDTPATATDLRKVNSFVVANQLSLSPGDPADWFKFEIVAPGGSGHAVSLAYDQSQGDIDL